MGDSSVDVVTTRSVLIYVRDKSAALREFYRVLRPSRRVSLFEPVNSLMDACDPDRFLGYDVRPVAAIAAKVMALYESIQPMGTDPMMDFDDRDLVRGAEEAGFAEVFLELRLSVKSKKQPCPWGRFLRMAGNPLVPPVGEVIDRALTAQEITEFSNYLKPLVESGTGKERTALAYLTAIKD